MTGFEFAQTCNTNEEKMIVLFIDAAKKAYNMAGKDFDTLPANEREEIVFNFMKKVLTH